MKKAGAINRKIIKLQKELNKVQDECKHDNKQIKMDNKGNAMWTCDECEKRLNYPNPSEMQKWINK